MQAKTIPQRPKILANTDREGEIPCQQTLGAVFEQSGIGLHSGEMTSVRVLPAPPGKGRYFVRVDLPDEPEIPATVESVTQTVLSTELGKGEARIRTVEHLLAALAGMGIDNARIEIDGPEVPVLDGSAQIWVESILQVGIALQAQYRNVRSLPDPLWIHQEDAFVAALPASAPRFTYGIDFDLPAIGNQWHSWSPILTQAGSQAASSFAVEIAPARTFGLAHQVDRLRQQGLIQGGSLDNALVCGAEGWLNPPLRFSNEPARHKILDLVGDVSLLGNFPLVHCLAYKASHSLHAQLTQLLSCCLVCKQ